MLDKCSAYCTRCINGQQSCQPNCFDNLKYFECQSECIESGRKDPQKCIEDKKCIQKCDKQCSKHWQGKYIPSSMFDASLFLAKMNINLKNILLSIRQDDKGNKIYHLVSY